jgi:hypothetical protein
MEKGERKIGETYLICNMGEHFVFTMTS